MTDHDGEIVDWLLWWDNALLHALRPHLPQATVLVAIRDPRDMLLDWLAFGSPAPLRIENPKRAASWLAHSLGHLVRLHEQGLQPHALLRLDDIDTDPAWERAYFAAIPVVELGDRRLDLVTSAAKPWRS